MTGGFSVGDMANSVLTAMTRANIWADVACVSSVYAGKMFMPSKDAPPSTMVKVWLLGEEVPAEQLDEDASQPAVKDGATEATYGQ
jgi:hypothetical protein